jgi:hypothetical protein
MHKPLPTSSRCLRLRMARPWVLPVGRGRGGRCALAVSLGCLGLLLITPTAGATGYGAVSGKVTGAASKAGIEGIEVRIYKGEDVWYPATTASNGSYTAAGVEPGEYKVKFIGTATKYATQYYKEKLSFAAATTISVEAGKELKEINAALSENASISGAVTSASSELELGNIEVTAYETNAPNAVVASVDTNQFGKYELKDLSKGAYVIGFKAALGSGLDYAPQFFPEKARFSEAPEVLVDEDVSSNVNAKLLQGASITGVVTDAATHQALPNVTVEALAVGGAEAPAALALTAADGSYELVGLASGTVEVAFVKEKREGEAAYVPYMPQLYDDRAFPEDSFNLAEILIFGTHLEVTVPLTTTGINAAMVREEPANTAAPTLSGTPSVGQTLSCTDGSWTGSEALTYIQAWLRDGTAIAGATGSTYVVQPVDAGHDLACMITATNKLASVSATSNALAVPLTAIAPIGVAPVAPVIVLSSAKLSISGGSTRVPISCADASCSGTIELTEQIVIKHRNGKKTVAKKETLILARGTYSLAAGSSAKIMLHLTATARSALAKSKQHRLAAEVVASVAGGKTVKRSVTLSQAVIKHATQL